MHMSFIHIVMHHTLHKTNNILSKFLLFSPKQVKITSDANRSRIKTRIQTGKLSERPTSLSSDNGSRINTQSQTGNPIQTITSYPPITGSGSMPEAQQGRYLHFANYYPLRVVRTKNYSDSFLLSTATTESGVRLSCLGWHLKAISDYLSTFLHLQNAAYLVKNQYKPITSYKVGHKV